MESLLPYFIQVNIYLIALYLIYVGFLRPLKNYKFSRPFLLIGIASAFALPFLEFSSVQVIETGALYSIRLPEVNITTTELSNGAISWSQAVIWLYALVSLVLAIKTIAQLSALFKVKAAATHKPDQGYYELKESLAAFSFFNWIFIGANHSAVEKAILLRHERVHVNRKHSLDIMLCQTLKIVLWPNIVLFKFQALFQELHEYEADELSWEKDDQYLHLLISQTFTQFPLITNQFKSTHLKIRIMRLKNQFKTKLTAPVLGLTALLFTSTVFINQNVKAGSSAIEKGQVTINAVDKAAEFPGGQVEMFKFIQGNIIFPKSMAEQGLSGKVFIQFNVQPDGTLTDFKALKSPHPDFTNQAMKVMKMMPKWNPAEKDGKKVVMQLTLPIIFDIPKPPTPPAPPTPEAPIPPTN